MLDRTIPFFNVIMRCDEWKPQEITLPDGYAFASYQDGYEDAWAKLEYEIGDFDCIEQAKQYFTEQYLSDKAELMKRGVFLTDPDKNVVGSCIAWKDARGQETVASLHWLVVSPSHQGKGLGRALCMKTMQVFWKNGAFPVYIHTQPWSWKAILLYVSLGFCLQKSDSFSHYENQYERAMETLKKVVSEEQYCCLLERSKV